MKSTFLKRSLSLSLAGAIILTSTGCATKNIKQQPDLVEFKELVKDYKPQKFSPIEEIRISGYTLKKNNLNQVIPESVNSKVITLNIKNKSLGQISKIGNTRVIVDPLLVTRDINLGSNLKGSLEEILKKIAYTTNSYWTYEEGIIKFKKTAEILYTFPALSLSKIAEVYNIGESQAASMNTGDSIFVDLKSVIDGLVESYSLEGSVVYSNEKNLSNTVEAAANKSNNNASNSNKNQNSSERNETVNDSNAKSQGNQKSNSSFAVKLNAPTSVNKKGKKKVSSGNGDSIVKKATNNEINSNNINSSDLKANASGLSKTSSSAYQKQSNSSENNSNSLLTKKSTQMTESFKSSSKRIVISPNSGTIIASLTPDEERILDTVLNTVMEKRFGNMIRLKTYALIVDKEKAKNFNAEFSSLVKLGSHQLPLSINGGNFGFTIPQAGVTDSRALFNGMVKYLVSNRDGEVLINPSIVALPNVMTRIQDTSKIPYLEPTDLGNDSGTVSYGISYVEEGINMSAIANVFDKNIIMALKFNVTQYLGDKTVTAGTLGTFNLPLSAPKVIQTTYRVSPGDILVLGGLKESKYTNDSGDSFFIPTEKDNASSKKEFIFIVMPTLIKFVVDNNEDNVKPLKDIDRISLSPEEKAKLMKDLEDKKEKRKSKAQEILDRKNGTEVKVPKTVEVKELTQVEEVIETQKDIVEVEKIKDLEVEKIEK